MSPEQVRALIEGISTRRVTGFRMNRLLSGDATERDFMERLGRDTGLDISVAPWDDHAAWVDAASRRALLASAARQAGQVYVQSLASQLPVRILDPQPGERILDLAAAPGSKTLQIAACVGKRGGDGRSEAGESGEKAGEVAAVEIAKKRMYKLRDNLAQHGARDLVRIYLQDGTRVWRYRPDYFDRVLVDAPCSSEGRFQAHDPDTMAYWSPGKVKEMVRKQRRLLYSACRAVRPGGTIVYSTCAVSVEENELAIHTLLEQSGGQLTVEPILPPGTPGTSGTSGFDAQRVPSRMAPVLHYRGQDLNPAIAGALRIVPSRLMEGFFVCRLRREL